MIMPAKPKYPRKTKGQRVKTPDGPGKLLQPSQGRQHYWDVKLDSGLIGAYHADEIHGDWFFKP
jgi:hypothetical protein